MDQTLERFLLVDLPTSPGMGAAMEPLTARDVELLAQLDAVLLPSAVRLREFTTRELVRAARDDVSGLADQWVHSAAARGLVRAIAGDRGVHRWGVECDVAMPRIAELLAERTRRREL